MKFLLENNKRACSFIRDLSKRENCPRLIECGDKREQSPTYLLMFILSQHAQLTFRTSDILKCQTFFLNVQYSKFSNIFSCSHDAFKDCPYEVDTSLPPSDNVNNDLQRKIDRIHGDINGSGQLKILIQFLKSRCFNKIRKRSRGVSSLLNGQVVMRRAAASFAALLNCKN